MRSGAKIGFVREPDPTSMITDFNAGNLDVIWQAPLSALQTLQRNRNAYIVKPAMFSELEHSYGTGNPTVASDDGEMTKAERAWGLAPPREYAEILAQTMEKDYRPRFSARGVVL